jgi:hypothetical protein
MARPIGDIPWSIHLSGTDPNYWMILDAHGKVVAIEGDYGGHPTPHMGHASLLAASPDLLQQLRMDALFFESYAEFLRDLAPGIAGELAAFAAGVRATIAKAIPEGCPSSLRRAFVCRRSFRNPSPRSRPCRPPRRSRGYSSPMTSCPID